MIDSCILIADNPFFTFGLLFAIQVLLFGAILLIPFNYYYLNPTFEKWQYKITRQYPAPQTVCDEMLYFLPGMLSSSFVSALALHLNQAVRDGTIESVSILSAIPHRAYCTSSSPHNSNESSAFTTGMLQNIGQFILLFLLYDIFVYTLHFVEHRWIALWKQQHRFHHAFANPSPFGAFAEEMSFFALNTFYLTILLPSLLPINWDILFAVAFLATVLGIYQHSGHELSFLNTHDTLLVTAYDHQWHHTYGSFQNLGGILKLLDQIVGTTPGKSRPCQCPRCRTVPRTRDDYENVAKPDYSVLWRDGSVWIRGIEKKLFARSSSKRVVV